MPQKTTRSTGRTTGASSRITVSGGAAGAVFAPAIAALTLGLVGRAVMPRRTGRNGAINHAGNVAAALLAGVATWWFGYEALFVMVAVMAAISAAAVLTIRERDIDHDLARGADDGPGHPHGVVGLGALLKEHRIAIFAASAVLFHLANAAMLPELSCFGPRQGDQDRTATGNVTARA